VVIGLVVNLLSARLLHHAEEEGIEKDQRNSPSDHNLKAAYLHVVADTLTSILAIAALSAGLFFGWVWVDPLSGILGSILILKWAYGLALTSAKDLVDYKV